MSDNRDGRPPNDVDDPGSALGGPPRRQFTTLQKIALPLFLAVVFVGVIWIEHLTATKRPAKQETLSFAPVGGTFRPAPALPAPAPAPPPLPLPSRSVVSPGAVVTGRREMTPAESPIFAFSGGQEGAEGTAAPAAHAAAAVPQPPEPTPPTPLSARLTATHEQGSRATLLPHPDMLVTEGTIIPCTLQTAIDTTLAGYVKCVLPAEVRGTTGNVVLLDRGTMMVGEIQSGVVNGQNRVFVLWDRAETPDHAIIQIDSPGTDELGRAGITGAVNNHFWERYGSAILLSLLQGTLQAGTALASNSGNGNGSGTGLYFNSFQQNGQGIGNTALEANINIPPTLQKNQGDNVAIFVARDLDFSDVYRLRLTGGRDAQ